MHYSLSCSRYSQLAAAATVSTALALNLVTPVPVQIGKQIQTHLVQLQAATASTVTNSAALDAASGSASALGSDSTGYQAKPSAAATTDGSFWSTPIGTALVLADIATLPIWFLFAPITLPVSMLVAASQTDSGSSFSTLQFLILTAIGFLTGPLGVASLLIKPSPTTAAALSNRTMGSAPVEAATESTTTQTTPTAPVQRRGKAVRITTPQRTSGKTANSKRSASAAGAAQSSDSPRPASARRTPLAAQGAHR